MIELVFTILILHMTCNGINRETMKNILFTLIFFFVLFFIKWLFFKIITTG